MMCGVAVASLAAAAEAAAQLSSQVANVIVTAGGMGLALVAECGQSPQVHAAHAVTLVDTHGAGDTFIGALVARLVDGSSLSEATRFANAAASLFVSTPVDQKKSVTFDRVAHFSLNLRGRRHPCRSVQGRWFEAPSMSKTALLEAPKLAGPVSGWGRARRETPSCCSGSAKQAPPPAAGPRGPAARALVQFNGLGSLRAVHPRTPTGYRRGHLA